MAVLQQFSVSVTLMWCIFLAAVLVYAPFILVVYGRIQVGVEALVAPRAVFDKLPAYAQRATWAHQNSFESFTLFAAAALMAYVTQVDSPWAVVVAIAYLPARFLYSVFYIFQVTPLRSLMFAIGSLSIGTLIVLSLLQAGF
ncbi:MAG: MAPEG family protein [Cyanobacteria bacterium CRU_2_1]|nr:MAPEG family protein [Cyanobacteria bacterium RU_5_0]NJR62879.1 MAPEG family protein [Cyanobacteria bacterium CRU_2_1]